MSYQSVSRTHIITLTWTRVVVRQSEFLIIVVVKNRTLYHCVHTKFTCLFFHRCLEVEDALRLQLEYTQQLLLSSLLSICSYLTSQGTDMARGLQIVDIQLTMYT